MEETIIKFISQVGIPAGIAAYVLVVLNQTVKSNTEILLALKGVLMRVCDKLNLDAEADKLATNGDAKKAA